MCTLHRERTALKFEAPKTKRSYTTNHDCQQSELSCLKLHRLRNPPEREKWLDLSRLIPLVANKKVFAIVDLSVLAAYVRPRRDIGLRHGKADRELARWVDLAEEYIRERVPGFVALIPRLYNSGDIVDPRH